MTGRGSDSDGRRLTGGGRSDCGGSKLTAGGDQRVTVAAGH